MKKIVLILIAILMIAVACCPNVNAQTNTQITVNESDLPTSVLDKMIEKKSVSISKLVNSVSEVLVNEKFELNLIQGATLENCQYRRRSDELIVECGENFTITFTEPGVYRLFFSGSKGGTHYGQHESYDITITD